MKRIFWTVLLALTLPAIADDAAPAERKPPAEKSLADVGMPIKKLSVTAEDKKLGEVVVTVEIGGGGELKKLVVSYGDTKIEAPAAAIKGVIPNYPPAFTLIRRPVDDGKGDWLVIQFTNLVPYAAMDNIRWREQSRMGYDGPTWGRIEFVIRDGKFVRRNGVTGGEGQGWNAD